LPEANPCSAAVEAAACWTASLLSRLILAVFAMDRDKIPEWAALWLPPYFPR
jgi:hypothetical protein